MFDKIQFVQFMLLGSVIVLISAKSLVEFYAILTNERFERILASYASMLESGRGGACCYESRIKN